MNEKWACRFFVIEKMSEVEDVNFKQRIMVKFFVKQDSLNKEIREQLLNCVQYTDNVVEMFWLSKVQDNTHAKIKRKDDLGRVF